MVDWWTLGILFYEMLVGRTPFYDRTRALQDENILHAPIKLPKNLSDEAKDLIVGVNFIYFIFYF